MRFFRRYWHWMLVTALFVVVVFVLAEVPVGEVRHIRQRVEEMTAERDMYRAQIEADSIFLENLKQDDFLERYAREKFYMKEEGEEIYVIYEDSLDDSIYTKQK
ncbi:MAG: septum formation initiator family protein [Tidjanibacter sp.]|nr:septum formation initiator family protein [Tidjanibacter sp.]